MGTRQQADDLQDQVMVYVGAERPSQVVCPREQSFMTPCIARDGHTALADDGVCVGCGADPGPLLIEIAEKIRLRPEAES